MKTRLDKQFSQKGMIIFSKNKQMKNCKRHLAGYARHRTRRCSELLQMSGNVAYPAKGRFRRVRLFWVLLKASFWYWNFYWILIITLSYYSKYLQNSKQRMQFLGSRYVPTALPSVTPKRPGSLCFDSIPEKYPASFWSKSIVNLGFNFFSYVFKI